MPAVQGLIQIVDRLRAEDGCPWDRAQTLSSMRPYLLEECYEVLEVIDQGQPQRLREELGDLLFEVVFLARLCEEEAPPFGMEEVAEGISRKMIDRHPHVFGDTRAHPDEGSIQAWESRKARSLGTRSRLDGVPRSLPALLRTHRQAEKASAVGFDWPDASAVLAKVREELVELEEAIEQGEPTRIEHEYGDALMALATVGRHIDTPPEGALRVANDRFAARFATMERLCRERGCELEALDDAGLDALWEAAKRSRG